MSIFLVMFHLLTLAPALYADPYSDRRKMLLDELDEGIAIIWGAGGKEYELRGQPTDFFYLTGLNQPNAALILLPGGKRLRSRGKILSEILYLPKRDSTEEMWTGTKLGPGEKAEKETGIDNVFDISKINGHIERYLRDETILHVSANMADLDEPLSRDQVWINALRDRNPFITFRDLSTTIATLRQVKGPEELELMRRAISITSRAIAEVMMVVSTQRLRNIRWNRLSIIISDILVVMGPLSLPS